MYKKLGSGGVSWEASLSSVAPCNMLIVDGVRWKYEEPNPQSANRLNKQQTLVQMKAAKDKLGH